MEIFTEYCNRIPVFYGIDTAVMKMISDGLRKDPTQSDGWEAAMISNPTAR